MNAELFDGEVTDTVGAVFGVEPFTVTVTLLVVDNPPESVTDAVMVWVPTDSVVSEKKLSVAKNPSMLEIHCICELSESSSASVAEAQNVILAPSSY